MLHEKGKWLSTTSRGGSHVTCALCQNGRDPVKGRRLSARAIDLIIRQLGHAANLELSAHILRHTCLSNLVRHGNDLVLVAEIAGHRRLETTRRYSLPSKEDREKAMEGLQIDY